MENIKDDARDFGDEYAFGEDVEYSTPKIDHNIRPCGNQGKNTETKKACTIVGAVNQIIRLFGIDLNMEKTNKLYIEAVKYCEKYWYQIGSWRSTPIAINTVCKRRNEIGHKAFNQDKIFRLRLYRSNEKIIEALNNWHLVWYTKNIYFWKDQVDWLVWRDKYPESTWHRLNRKGIKFTKATGGADISQAERWSQDNYSWQQWENFAFKTVKKYINNWIYAYWYLIMPESCMKSNIEDQKEKIAKMKAINSTLWVLTSTRWDMDEAFQELSSSYAQALREQYPDARKLEENQEKKVYQALVDLLSYSWKFAWEEEQKKYSELADFLRKKHDLK